jgi:hypothetical protein
LAALGASGDGAGLGQRAGQILGHEAAQLMHGDMVVVAGVEQVGGEIGRAAPLIAVQDQGGRLPRGRRAQSQTPHERIAHLSDLRAGLL